MYAANLTGMQWQSIDTSMASGAQVEVQHKALRRSTGTQTRTPTLHGFARRDIGRAFWAWKGCTLRERKDVAHGVLRMFGVVGTRATLTRMFSAWVSLVVRAGLRILRLSREIHRWRAILVQHSALRAQSKESWLKEREDDQYMMSQRNDDLQLAVDTLRVDLQDETAKLENSRGTNTELLKRLKVSDDCINIMRKDFHLKCDRCKSTLSQSTHTADTESRDTPCPSVMEDQDVDVMLKASDLRTK
ncbi:hypothetical protein CYMTET_55084 [Cymbomonas tetramitiformis]|uniref:Uncharacterized protein n=1 Tax=Cymbomonas tetramitiformis TaxID=36881 RepID=A0AAE0EN11_9CHLO|nr:hypothetical protein CYMTET_55084 [Cymbomonas tetramitiformis]